MRQTVGQELVEYHPEREDVAPHVDLVRVATGLFRAHIGQRANNPAHVGTGGQAHFGIGDAGQPKIQDLGIGL